MYRSSKLVRVEGMPVSPFGSPSLARLPLWASQLFDQTRLQAFLFVCIYSYLFLFWFLVSFGGTYLGNDTNVVPSGCKSDGDSSSMDHQLLKIHVPRTEAGLFGPAFVEVENESGLSNFIPILIAEKDICAEMKEIQRKFCSGVSERTAVCSPCEASTSRKSEFAEFMLDVAWLLREPSSENVQILASVQMQRFNYLLNILMESQSTIILERVLSYFENMVKRNMLAGITDADMRLFQRNIREKNNLLKERLHRKEYFAGDSRQIMQEANTSNQIFQNHMLSVFPVINQDTEVPDKHNIEFDSTYWERTSTVPLLDAELALRVKEEQSVKSCGFLVRKTVVTSRTLVFLIAGFAVCLGLCATFLHPRKVGEFAMTIRSFYGCFDDTLAIPPLGGISMVQVIWSFYSSDAYHSEISPTISIQYGCCVADVSTPCLLLLYWFRLDSE
ncbi:hypothetical protein CQW23_02232 [Capsicum baccatum]|uniref:Uncharacterized protein n=1 Tax=Capsicum baccatum TaxID=33114 RepID=A0A2G2XQY8_CAPBA|nr:hypothetical protein CQW23_02232 [Capsicum baccatum]